MATVGHLNINVNARTAKFSKKMKGVSATVKRMAMGFGKIALKVAKFAAVLGGIAVAAVIALTKSGIKSVNLLGKTADKLGIIPKKLQVLQLAAKSTGVTVETFNMAMQRMVRRVSEAGHGFGEAKGALEELGLDAKALSKLPVDEQFARIADEMEKVSTQGDRVRLAMKLFDSEGVSLVNTMKGGSKALNAFKKEAEELGLLLGGEQVRAVEVLETKLGFLSSVWSNLSQQLAVQFAPVLTEITNRIIKFIKDSGGMGVMAEGIAKAFFHAGAFILDTIKIIQIGWLGLKAAVIQAASEVVAVIGHVVQLGAEGFNKLKSVGILAASAVASTWGWASGFIADTLNELEFDSAATWVRITGNVSKALGPALADVGVAKWGETVQNDMADFLKSISDGLGDDAAATGLEMLNKLAEGFSQGKVNTTFESLKDRFMGKGFDITAGEGRIELTTPDFKGVADTLTTAIGSMKVEGDSQSRIASQSLNVEKEHLQTSKDTLVAIRSGGMALT